MFCWCQFRWLGNPLPSPKLPPPAPGVPRPLANSPLDGFAILPVVWGGCRPSSAIGMLCAQEFPNQCTSKHRTDATSCSDCSRGLRGGGIRFKMRIRNKMEWSSTWRVVSCECPSFFASDKYLSLTRTKATETAGSRVILSTHISLEVHGEQTRSRSV